MGIAVELVQRSAGQVEEVEEVPHHYSRQECAAAVVEGSTVVKLVQVVGDFRLAEEGEGSAAAELVLAAEDCCPPAEEEEGNSAASPALATEDFHFPAEEAVDSTAAALAPAVPSHPTSAPKIVNDSAASPQWGYLELRGRIAELEAAHKKLVVRMVDAVGAAGEVEDSAAAVE